LAHARASLGQGISFRLAFEVCFPHPADVGSHATHRLPLRIPVVAQLERKAEARIVTAFGAGAVECTPYQFLRINTAAAGSSDRWRLFRRCLRGLLNGLADERQYHGVDLVPVV